MKKKLIIFGIGEMSEVAYFYFSHDSLYEVHAFSVTSDKVGPEMFFGLPVVPFERIESRYSPQEYGMFIAIGYSGLNRIRKKFYEEAKQKGYCLASYISSKSVNWIGSNVGDNCFILENQTIQPFVTIGNNVVLWSGNHIGHHAKIGDHCFIASHVVISGGVVIEPYCFLGVNATIFDHVTIRENCIIGAGAMISKETEPDSVYVGPLAKRYPKKSSAVDL